MSVSYADDLPDAGVSDASVVDAPQPVVVLPVPLIEGKHKDKKDKDDKDHKKADKKKKGELEFGGRIFARSEIIKLAPAPDATLSNSIASARGKIDYTWKELRAELQVEFAGKPKLKNVFAELRVLHWHDHAAYVRAGQFKVPFSAIELTSLWSLPLADRGLIHTVEVNRLQIAGRAIGAMATLEVPNLRLFAGAFQGTDDAGEPLVATAHDAFGQGAAVRLEWKPLKGFEVGASASTRAGMLLTPPPVIRRAYAADVDAHVDLAAGPGRVRGWAELVLGTSWLVDPARTTTMFRGARAIAAYRIGGAKQRKRYAEVYGQFGALDPDAQQGDDLVVDATGGITYGGWNLWRVQLEVSANKLGPNARGGIVELNTPPIDSFHVLAQLGAHL